MQIRQLALHFAQIGELKYKPSGHTLHHPCCAPIVSGTKTNPSLQAEQ